MLARANSIVFYRIIFIISTPLNMFFFKIARFNILFSVNVNYMVISVRINMIVAVGIIHSESEYSTISVSQLLGKSVKVHSF